MPVVEQALAARLEGSTAFTSVAGTRIYPDKLPQDPTLPAATYNLISSIRDSYMGTDDGDVTARVQVTCWGITYASASSVSEGVRGALQRWSGTSTGVVVDEIFIENEFAFFDERAQNHAHTMDLIVHYKE